MYYIGAMAYGENALQHHGVKGMKWGVRRYQNEDGTLTEAGRVRYGTSKNYDRGSGGVVRRLAKSSFAGRRTVAEGLARRRERRANWWQENADYDYTLDGFTKEESDSMRAASQKRADKLRRKAEAQRAANANREAYEAHTSTGKLVVQDLLLTKYGAQNYRAARARGAGRVRSLLETTAGLTPIATTLTMVGNKKAYGSALVLSAI